MFISHDNRLCIKITVYPNLALKLKPSQAGVGNVISIHTKFFRCASSGDYRRSQNLIIRQHDQQLFLAYNSMQIAVTPVSIKGVFTLHIVSLNTSLYNRSIITYRSNVTSQNFLFINIKPKNITTKQLIKNSV